MQRKAIRDQIKAILEPALLSVNPHIQIFTYEKGVIETGDPVVSIYFNSGDVTTYIDFEEHQGALNITLLIPDQPEVDDALDALAETLRTTMKTQPTLNNLITEQRHTNWTYDRTSFPGWTGLTLTYALNY